MLIFDHALDAGEVRLLSEPVPEPSSVALLAIGGLFALVPGIRRRRK